MNVREKTQVEEKKRRSAIGGSGVFLGGTGPQEVDHNPVVMW